MRKYELWLDETGKFTKEAQIDGSNSDKVPSMIGGVLVPMGLISNQTAKKWVGEDAGHGTELDAKKVRDCLIPGLKNLKEAGAKFVFFENRKRETRDTAMELYLDMMVDGILQVISFLSMYDQEFQLDILIAVRYAEEAERIIVMEDYAPKLKEELLWRLKKGNLYVDEDVKVNLLISRANPPKYNRDNKDSVEFKLQLADYACTGRRINLTKLEDFSNKKKQRFNATSREALSHMYDEHYVFHFKEHEMVDQIRRRLSENKLAEAILLYCNDKELLKDEAYLNENRETIREKNKWMICEKMRQLGKLEVRCQMEELISDINASIQMENEYEWGEIFLDKLKEEFLEELKKYEIYDEKLDLEIALSYAYLYLKEGDLKELEKEILRAEDLYAKLPQCFDFVEYKVIIWILKLAYSVFCLDLEEAKKWEAKISYYMENLKDLYVMADIWEDEDIINDKLQTQANRYAQMRMYLSWLAGDEEAEKGLLEAVEILKDKSFEEEIRMFPRGCYNYLLRRGQEMQALDWLLSFVGIQVTEEELNSRQVPVLRENFREFCHILVEMDGKQKSELLREYIYAMYMIKKRELQEETVQVSYSSMMHQELTDSGLLKEVQKEVKDLVEIDTNLNVDEDHRYRHLVRRVMDDFQDKIYHPMEQVWWLYGAYLNLAGASVDEVNKAYQKAQQICEWSNEYDLMVRTGLMIRVERTAEKLLSGNKKALQEVKKVKEAYENTVNSEALTETSKNTLSELFAPFFDLVEKEAPAEVLGLTLYEIVEKMYL